MDMHLFLLEFEKERLWHFSKNKYTWKEVPFEIYNDDIISEGK